MPAISQKNRPLTGIANAPDFGGGQLSQQLQDETEEERRRRLLGLSANPRSQAQPIMTPATTSLFQAMGMGGGRR
jgi:hypothetical protein